MLKAPLSSASACLILDLLEDGWQLEQIVEPSLVEPIKDWLNECQQCQKHRGARDVL